MEAKQKRKHNLKFAHSVRRSTMDTRHFEPWKDAASSTGSKRITDQDRSAVALSYWSIKHSFFAFFVTYGLLFGLGQGIAYVTAVATIINWAPEKVGLMSGIVAAGFGVSSSIFAPIQTRLINPDNLPSTRDGYFLDKDLLLRVPDVFLTLAWVYAIMQFIGLIVICDPPEKIRSSGLGSISDFIDELRHGSDPSRRRQRFATVSYKQLPRDEITIMETIAMQQPITDIKIHIDKKSDLVGVFICMGATHALFITAAVKCFGARWKATNYGFLTFSTTCSGILLSVISQFYLTSIGYTWLFIITAAFPFIAAIIIAHNEKLVWRGKLFPKLQNMHFENKTLRLATIAIYDNPRLCVPPDEKERLREITNGTSSLDNTFIQKCHCDMEILQEMAKKFIDERRSLQSIGQCTVFSGDLIINEAVPDNFKHFVLIEAFKLAQQHYSDRTAIEIKDNSNLQEINMPLLRILHSVGMHVDIRDNQKLHIPQITKLFALSLIAGVPATKERFLVAILGDPNEHEKSTIHIETKPCQISVLGFSQGLQHCEIVEGDIDITKLTLGEHTNLEYLSS
ncbi:hypothetical protein TELCIR_06597, partial [Teladorsagia circumcincta]